MKHEQPPDDSIVLSCTVTGIPAPAGSKSAFAIKRGGVYTGKTVVTDSGGEKTADWKRTVKFFVREHFASQPPEDGPLGMLLVFMMPRPKGHFRSGKHAGKLKPTTPQYHCKKPDTTKLVRGVEDAMSGVVWRDDTQIVKQHAVKIWADESPGVFILVWRMPEGTP